MSPSNIFRSAAGTYPFCRQKAAGTCPFCRQKAAVLSPEHPECRRTH